MDAVECETEIVEELSKVEAEIGDVEDEIKVLLERQEKLYGRQSELKAILKTRQARVPQGSGSETPIHVQENWSGPFPWDAQADNVRLNVFGIPTFRHNQRQVEQQ